jgi:16S rRNA (cytidine1402-2'-O)-methyltransferase
VPVLYIVATPIGNLEDISIRALRILKQVKLIAAEDTRTTRNLLDKYEIKTKLTSYYEHSRRNKIDYILQVLREDDVAVVSEAGMPGISDAGYELVQQAVQNNIKVVVIPGASAVITALVLSGLPADQFIYTGFLPRAQKARKQFLQTVVEEQRTIVAFEAPHRLLKSLGDIKLVMGDRKIAVCREMTKKYEEIFRGTVSESIEHFSQPRGEFTLVIEGAGTIEKQIDGNIREKMLSLRKKGLTAREAVALMVKETGVSRKELYSLWISIKKEKTHA